MKYFELEKRGCNFRNDDPICIASDVGNYRLDTPNYCIKGKDGRIYYVEITRGDKRVTRYTDKRNGRPLLHPVVETVATNIAYFDFSYRSADGNVYRDTSLWYKAWDAEIPYRSADILAFINSISADHYDGIRYI